ncbi:MAG: phosphodiester glycosidase family protein [Lachnospiraceae bacterium]|nr:phosphodiester glycosidase family protein [Lachnospiraceae bacterium]
MLKKRLFPILYGLLLTAFTVYTVLDTFVITRVYGAASGVETSAITVSSANTAKSSSGAEAESGSLEDTAGTASTENAGSADASGNTAETESSSRGSHSSRRNEGRHSRSEASAENSSETASTGQSAGSNSANSSSSDSSTASSSGQTVSADSYQDENISVSLTEYRVNDTTVYVADVVLSSAEYLKTALAQGLYGRNVTESTSAMAESSNAILAINGDYYGARQKGYVLKNGVLYRSTASKNQEDLVIYADGSFEIINESEISAEELLANGAVQILSFGPALVTDGSISVSTDEEVGQAKSSNPRTAIGVIDDLHYLFVVSDGRTDESEGLSLYELASFMESLGAKTAYNLDGGGSSTMVFNGTLINNPTSSGSTIKERSVSDIVYIGYE